MSTRRWARWWAIGTGVLAVIATVTGWIGYGSYLKGQPGFGSANFFDRLFYTFQLFVLGPAPFGGPPYGWWLSIASFLAPLTTVVAVVQTVSSAFRSSWEAWTLRRAHGHDVVVGRTPEAFALAQVLGARTVAHGQKTQGAVERRVVMLGTNITTDVARRHNLSVVAGEAVDEEALRAAGVPGAARVFALDESGATNAAVALHVRSLQDEAQSICRLETIRLGKWLLETASAAVRRRVGRTRIGKWLLEKPSKTRDIAVYARADDAALVAAMRARRLGAEADLGFRVDFFSIHAIAAVALLDEHDPGPEPLVVGSDDFAKAVRAELERRRRRKNVPDPVRCVSAAQAEREAERLIPPSGSATYVSETDTDTVLRVGLHLMLSDHPRVVLCLGRKAPLADALGKRLFDRVNELTVFGILDAACEPDRLTSNALVEQLAQAVHADYRKKFGGSGHASDVDWEVLEERFKEDNREQADDIGRKLASIEAVIVPSPRTLPAFSLTDAEVEKLAEMEHARWMENKERAGIVWGPVRTSKAHPDMRPWTHVDKTQELDEASKEKDRETIRGLPKMLEAENLAIVRRAGT